MQEMQEILVRSLDEEDTLEEEMPTHSSILAWKIPWTEEPGGLQSVGSPGVRCDSAHRPMRVLLWNFFLFLSGTLDLKKVPCILGEGAKSI